MTRRDDRPPALGAVLALQRHLAKWLRDQALPLWDLHGVDRDGGGYFEDIAVVGSGSFRASGEVRRGRVVARQIYVFDVGRRWGWRSEVSDPVAHGADYLFSQLHRGEGVFHAAVGATSLLPSHFSLYEQAFYLFALAHLRETQAERHPVDETAGRCLEQLRRGWGKANGGFDESAPATLPLKSNPHMHLLEAALAWILITEGLERRVWLDLAQELVSLCLTRFIDGRSGAVREYFDHQWQPLLGAEGRILEPGHQFEWAWLLLRWASSVHCEEAARLNCRRAARRLMDVGERFGVDPRRGIAVNEIWDDMSRKDAAAKIWPQTERVKAWCAMLDAARTPVEAQHACAGIVAAGRGLVTYFRADAPGLWHELSKPDGSFADGACKASSLYHIVCAVDVLRHSVDAHLERSGACSPATPDSISIPERP